MYFGGDPGLLRPVLCATFESPLSLLVALMLKVAAAYRDTVSLLQVLDAAQFIVLAGQLSGSATPWVVKYFIEYFTPLTGLVPVVGGSLFPDLRFVPSARDFVLAVATCVHCHWPSVMKLSV